MKYTIREEPDNTYTLLRYGEPAANHQPTNSELEFWLTLQAERESVAELLRAVKQFVSSDPNNATDAIACRTRIKLALKHLEQSRSK